jgi:hypothetical protein
MSNLTKEEVIKLVDSNFELFEEIVSTTKLKNKIQQKDSEVVADTISGLEEFIWDELEFRDRGEMTGEEINNWILQILKLRGYEIMDTIIANREKALSNWGALING